MFNMYTLLRENIKKLKPYSSARDEFQGEASVYLDANENPYENGINRYPDPLQQELKVQIGHLKDVLPERIFLGNGSDEAIDLLFRAFCEPGTDNVVAMKPTYGMYKVCADINNVTYKEVLLKEDYSLDVDGILNSLDNHTKIVFLCSPNNPTGNSLAQVDVLHILDCFDGLVVIDEAYIDFSTQNSFTDRLNNYPNLVVLQTFSKAWGMAGARLGMAFASKEIIQILNSIKYPYNINVLTQDTVLDRLATKDKVEQQVKEIIAEREKLITELSALSFVDMVYPTEANFVLVRVNNPVEIYKYLMNRGVIVRDRSKVALCEGCLRITVGTDEDNRILIEALKELKAF